MIELIIVGGAIVLLLLLTAIVAFPFLLVEYIDFRRSFWIAVASAHVTPRLAGGQRRVGLHKSQGYLARAVVADRLALQPAHRHEAHDAIGQEHLVGGE